MRTIGASEFKAGCLAIIDEVARSGEPVQVSKRGKVVVRMIPVLAEEAEYPQDLLAGTVRSIGDIVDATVRDQELDSVTGRELRHGQRKRSR
jgi:antitoxin (DNA-binding transcriptional repressor) of toxin-antitoxin stability system